MNRLITRAHRLARVATKAAWALLHRRHPILAQVVPMRRCNLACAYCNEYDTTSSPVPLEEMLARLDKLADLGTSMITVSGGEPLMHPDLDAMIVRMRQRRMVSSIITNGYYLSPGRIRRLNAARLDYLQISIDNVEPDEVSMKSLRLLEPKLKWLAELAEFSVNVNSVVGGGIKVPEDALVVARRARELGFTSSVGIIHDGRGQLRAFDGRQMEVYRALQRMGSRGDTRVNRIFQDNLAHGRANQWRCRAGARYLYVDEGGLVHYCSQQRGTPGIPLAQYTADDLRREYDTPKACAPYCTVNCVQRVALFDNWRSPQKAAPPRADAVPAPAAAPASDRALAN
ncbi:MAG: radical SAM protein [Acidobacteria bacterium]|nr:MAG: radical SAM protein [Acidobacteriota bacterium]